MGTNIRTNISVTNPYHIDKHEYLMARHFALMYPEWKRQKNEIESRIAYAFRQEVYSNGTVSKPVETIQEAAEKYSARIDLIERIAKNTGEEIWEKVLIGVTTECSYEYLRLVKNIPCCKDVYYRMYRKFFWMLSQEMLRLLDD